MTIELTKAVIMASIDTYKRGNYSVSDCLRMIDKDIRRETDCIPNIDKRLTAQNKLYLYGLNQLEKAIKSMERR